jgi:hypothetical protein
MSHPASCLDVDGDHFLMQRLGRIASIPSGSTESGQGLGARQSYSQRGKEEFSIAFGDFRLYNEFAECLNLRFPYIFDIYPLLLAVKVKTKLG